MPWATVVMARATLRSHVRIHASESGGRNGTRGDTAYYRPYPAGNKASEFGKRRDGEGGWIVRGDGRREGVAQSPPRTGSRGGRRLGGARAARALDPRRTP